MAPKRSADQMAFSPDQATSTLDVAVAADQKPGPKTTVYIEAGMAEAEIADIDLTAGYSYDYEDEDWERYEDEGWERRYEDKGWERYEDAKEVEGDEDSQDTQGDENTQDTQATLDVVDQATSTWEVALAAADQRAQAEIAQIAWYDAEEDEGWERHEAVEVEGVEDPEATLAAVEKTTAWHEEVKRKAKGKAKV